MLQHLGRAEIGGALDLHGFRQKRGQLRFQERARIERSGESQLRPGALDRQPTGRVGEARLDRAAPILQGPRAGSMQREGKGLQRPERPRRQPTGVADVEIDLEAGAVIGEFRIRAPLRIHAPDRQRGLRRSLADASGTGERKPRFLSDHGRVQDDLRQAELPDLDRDRQVRHLGCDACRDFVG